MVGDGLELSRERMAVLWCERGGFSSLTYQVLRAVLDSFTVVQGRRCTM